MDRFKPVSPDPFIVEDQDMTLARFGHINAIVDALNEVVPSTSGLMYQSQYDPFGTGSVNDSRRLGNQLPAYYLNRANHTGTQSQATISGLVGDLALKGDMFRAVYDTNLNGIVDNSERLGSQLPAYYLNRVNHTGSQAISTVTGLQTALDDKLDDSQLGVDIATLVGGVIPLAQLPFSSSLYLGLYDASTNTPAIINGTGTAGEFYIANITGNAYAPVNVTLVNQVVAYNGSVWQVGAVFTGSISDVNGQTGPTVTLDLDDIPDTATRAAVTPAHAQALAGTAVPANASNPVATAADITVLSNAISNAGDMKKVTYDVNNTGIVDNSERLGGQLPAFYTSRTNHTGTQPQSSVANLITDLAAKIPFSEKGANSGVCELDVNGKVPASRLNLSALNYQNSWNATTNSPSIANGIGTAGDTYIVGVGGTRNLGSGNITFNVGDLVVYNGTVWQKIAAAVAGVTSINALTGVVTLNSDQVPQGSTNFYLTANQNAAADNANSPGAGNPFATNNDLTPLASDISTLQSDVTTINGNLSLKENKSEKGVALGYCELDASGKVPNSRLNFSPTNYQNSWNALTNNPPLADGAGTAGDTYIVGTAGTQNLGSGAITFNVGDLVIYNGSVWQKITGVAPGVSSVNGFSGAVTLTADNIAETATRYYLNANQNAAVDAAVTASGANRFATLADLSAIGTVLFITPDEFAYGYTIGDNTTRTLAMLGISLASAQALWPLTYAASLTGWVSTFSTSMTVDWFAIQEAFLTIEQGNQRTSFLSPNGARKYRVNHTVKLPRYNNEGADTSIIIDFNGSKIINVSGNNIIVVDRFAPNTATALNVWGTNPLHIKNLAIEGNGVNVNTANIGLRVAPNFKGSYTNVFISSCAVHMALYFNLLVRVADCQFTGCGLYCVVASDASPSSNTLGYSWPDATNSNSQCNANIFDNVRFQPQSAATVVSAYYGKGGYSHIIRDSNCENLGGTTQYVLLYEGNGDPSDSLMMVQNFAYEISGNVSQAIIGVKNGKGIATIQNADGYVNGGAAAFVEANNRAGTGTPTIVIRDCENAYNFKFKNVVAAPNLNNARDRAFTWRFEHVGVPVKTNIFDSNNWVLTGGAPIWNGIFENAIVPDPIHVSYQALFSSVNDFNFNGVDQLVPDVNNWTRTSPVVGTNTPTAENLIPEYIGQFYLKLAAPTTLYVGTGTLNNTQWLALN